MRTLKSMPKIDDTIRNELTEKQRLRTGVKTGELKMLMFIAEHNLPLKLLDHLPQFISSVCYDSEVAKSLYETTDVSSTKCLAVIARYYRNDPVDDKYLGLVEVKEATAESLFNAIKQLLQENEIPLSNMIGLVADNASVMQGNKKGVQARFQQEIPRLFILGCVCHSLALCSSAACKKLPQSVESLAKDIISYFSHSSKRLEELKECPVFAEIKPHKLLKLSQTRWFSLQAVVNRILEQWSALILFFTNESYNKNKDNIMNPQPILDAVNNDVFKLYFSFLSYILDIVNKINIEFQSQHPKLYLLHVRVTHTNRIQQTDLDRFKIKCLDFYIELSKQILNRFNFKDPVLKFLNNFDPVVATSGTCESVVPLASIFPQLVKDLENLNTEWRDLSTNEEIIKHLKDSTGKVCQFEKFWAFVFNMKNGMDEYMFPNLTYFLKRHFLSAPFVSDSGENFFTISID
ncbi:hypothetical protein NQ314_014365 [Rhamnusium bicolor]|uniref:DUF4371 domain-containing protein n=1 Tax=Rhamnusium bicolor TaxID=1586634 RepID=A0AAV8X237_9CUCU|nr:hypothetical protein NQ314_014365 [Rhamnusium bicolor]